MCTGLSSAICHHLPCAPLFHPVEFKCTVSIANLPDFCRPHRERFGLVVAFNARQGSIARTGSVVGEWICPPSPPPLASLSTLWGQGHASSAHGWRVSRGRCAPLFRPMCLRESSGLSAATPRRGHAQWGGQIVGPVRGSEP